MRGASDKTHTATDSIKENTFMRKRLASLAALLGAIVLLLAIPSLASAASPWWQVLTGSRPTNMWKPVDPEEVQEVEVEEFAGLIAADEVEVEGEVVGCLGAGTLVPFGGPGADEICEEKTGFPASETAAQFKAMLEGPYGAGAVEVSGGPVGTLPLEVTSPWLPAVVVRPIEAEIFGETFPVGTASAKVLTEGSGRLVLTLTNLGDAPVDGSSDPVRIVDHLPAGVAAYGVEVIAGGNDTSGPVDCRVESSDEVACTFDGHLPSYEAIEVEIEASLTDSLPAAGAPGEVSVSGGGAPAVSTSQAVKVSPEPTPFGLERFEAQAEEEGGAPTAQAGAHPFQLTTTVQLNAGRMSLAATRHESVVEQPALPRNLTFPLPMGLVGNATAMPQCSMADFFYDFEFVDKCADATAIGVASVTVVEHRVLGFLREAVPVFNLPPAQGEPARFGFLAVGVPVVIDTAVDPDNGYRIVASIHNVSQAAQFLSGTVSLWGTPGDPRHDSSRGWGCAYFLPGGRTCERPADQSETAFLREPVQCANPIDFSVSAEPWNVPIGSQVDSAGSTGKPLLGCNRAPFDPAISAVPTTKLAENASGLDFDLTMPNSGLLKGEAIAEGQPKKVEVTLPEGMSINPSDGEGLVGCSPAEYARETVDSRSGEGCPEASKIGTVQISTPLLEEEAHGALYVASPFDNPSNSLLALYLVARIPDRGIIVKQAGKVTPNTKTGQLVTTFDNLPQLPFSSFDLQFRPGGRAPLVTPPACGKYGVVARFTPWSAQDPDNPAPDEIVTRTSTFTVERGVDGGACPPGGTPPFHPGLLAGTINNAAGQYSPFNVRLTRNDGEQEFTHFSIKLPPGVSGKLAGIPLCSDPAIAAAKARTGPNGGAEELEHPSCPAASQVGRTLVGAGVGTSLTYVPGRVYLAGPYHGAPISIVSITAAKVGPFDLGTVVVREALKVNPVTAEVFVDAAGSDPIPHIIQGIPVHARDIRVYVDRPEFTLNPTNCERTSTASTVLGSGLDFGSEADDDPVTVSTRFQAADCAALAFKPKLALSLKGSTKRGKFPALKAVVTYPKGSNANIRRSVVVLPPTEFLAQGHIGTTCTRVQFNAGGGNGEQCPKRSIYGHAQAITPLLDEPLEGPVYLRSNGGERRLPDLVAAMHGKEISIDLVGFIDSVQKKGSEVSRIRNVFAAVPDAPVKRFTLQMFGGKKGLLQNASGRGANTICQGTHRAISEFTGQNGKVYDTKPVLKAKCGKHHKRKAHKHHGKEHGR